MSYVDHVCEIGSAPSVRESVEPDTFLSVVEYHAFLVNKQVCSHKLATQVFVFRSGMKPEDTYLPFANGRVDSDRST